MFDIPGFDPSSMTEDELMQKQAELSRRLGWAARFGPSMASQLYAMIGAIEQERRDRILRVMFQERQKMFPDIIESEPDLAVQHKKNVVTGETDDRMANRRRAGRERMALTRTTTPSNQQTYVPPERVDRTSEPTPEPEDTDESKSKDKE